MRITRPLFNNLALATLTLFLLTVATEVMAPPGGGPPGGAPGGRGPQMGRMPHHRTGPASGGSFASRPTPRRDIRRAPRSTTQRSIEPYQRRTLPAAPLKERQEIRDKHKDQRRQTREKYENQRKQAREKYANPPGQVREEYENRNQPITEVREDHREEIQEIHEDRREEVRDEHWDRWHHRGDLGRVYTTTDFDYESCQVTTIVDEVTYYACDGVWYKRAYSGDTVTYVVVDRPSSG